MPALPDHAKSAPTSANVMADALNRHAERAFGACRPADAARVGTLVRQRLEDALGEPPTAS
jgi:hypothetical protein